MKTTRAVIIEICAAGLVLISFSAVIGKVFGWQVLSNWGRDVNLSLPACAGFFLAGVAIRNLMHKEDK